MIGICGFVLCSYVVTVKKIDIAPAYKYTDIHSK